MNGTTGPLVARGAAAGILVWAILVAGCASPPATRTVYVEQPAPPPQTTTVEDARSFLREEPSGEAALEEAERFRAAGNQEAVFLLVKYSARKHVPLGAYEMGRYYDPATHRQGGVVLNPDVGLAASWFRWAARGGHVGAMARLGEMYRDGVIEATGGNAAIRNGVPRELLEMNAVERGFYWLDRAARAGGSSQ